MDARNQLTCPIILRQTISYTMMWKSRSAAESKIALRTHKTSSPRGASALYSGFEEDGWLQSIRPGLLLTESQINRPPGHSPSDQACPCQGSLTPPGPGQYPSRHRAGSPRDQPWKAEGRAVSRTALESWPCIGKAVILTNEGVGNAYANLKTENTLLSIKRAGPHHVFLWSKWDGPV